MATSSNNTASVAELLRALREQGISPDEIVDKLNNADSDCELVGETSPKKKARTETPKKGAASTRRTRSTVPPSVKKEMNVKNLDTRQIIPQMVLTQDFMKDNLLVEVQEALEFQGWGQLFEKEALVSEESVRNFYAGISIEVRGKYQMVHVVIGDMDQWFMVSDVPVWLGIPAEGYSEYHKKHWPKEVAAKDITGRVMGTNSGGSAAMDLPPLQRVLHRFIVQNITPRLQKHQVVSIMDFILLDKLVNKEPISLPQLMVSHMSYVMESSTHGLPYPGLVKVIMERLSIYQPTKEVSLSFPISKDHLEKLGLTFHEGTGWTKRPAEPDAEVDQPADEAEADIPLPVRPAEASSEELGALRISINRLAEEVVVLRHSVEAERKARTPSVDLADLKSLMEMMNKDIVGLKHKMDTFEEKGDYFIKAFKRAFMPPSP